MPIHRWNSILDGPFSEAALRRRLEDEGWSVSTYVYAPGTHFAEHTHAVDKIDAVVHGRFQLVLNGEAVVLEAGEWIDIPRGAPHTATVIGRHAVTSLDAVRRSR